MSRPNILYFVCHDLGKVLGTYGALVESPVLDQFAASGVRFDNAFCSSPACSPSRACAMTGRYAHNNGTIGLAHMGWSLPQSEQTITEYLHEGGYETIHSGLAHERQPEANHYEVELEEDWDDWHAHNAVGKAVQYLRKRDHSRPFYLNIGTQQVHQSAWHLADKLYGGAVPPEKVWVPPFLPDNPTVRQNLGRFQASIRFLDEQFGILLKALEEAGYLDNTLIVFTTDHGISGLRAKGSLYDRGTEIALLMRLPGGKMAGTTVPHLIPNIDFVPTFLEAAGLPISEKVQGRSFWPLLSGQPYEPHHQVFIERNFHGERVPRDAKDYIDLFDPLRSVRTPEFHYIRRFRPEVKALATLPVHIAASYAPGSERYDEAWPEAETPRPTEELYHLTHDPNEWVNVADHPEYADIKTSLAQKLTNWQHETEDFALSDITPPRLHDPGWGAWS